jgi:hypothetical protein
MPDRLVSNAGDKQITMTILTLIILAPQAPPEGRPISSENKGAKLLKLMGWSGKGGLGKTEQGRDQPVFAEQRAGKASLLSNNMMSQFCMMSQEILVDFYTDRHGALDYSPNSTAPNLIGNNTGIGHGAGNGPRSR